MPTDHHDLTRLLAFGRGQKIIVSGISLKKSTTELLPLDISIIRHSVKGWAFCQIFEKNVFTKTPKILEFQQKHINLICNSQFELFLALYRGVLLIHTTEKAKKSYELVAPSKSKFLTKFQAFSETKGFTKLPRILWNYISKFDLILRVDIMYRISLET